MKRRVIDKAIKLVKAIDAAKARADSFAERVLPVKEDYPQVADLVDELIGKAAERFQAEAKDAEKQLDTL